MHRGHGAPTRAWHASAPPSPAAGKPRLVRTPSCRLRRQAPWPPRWRPPWPARVGRCVGHTMNGAVTRTRDRFPNRRWRVERGARCATCARRRGAGTGDEMRSFARRWARTASLSFMVGLRGGLASAMPGPGRLATATLEGSGPGGWMGTNFDNLGVLACGAGASTDFDFKKHKARGARRAARGARRERRAHARGRTHA